MDESTLISGPPPSKYLVESYALDQDNIPHIRALVDARKASLEQINDEIQKVTEQMAAHLTKGGVNIGKGAPNLPRRALIMELPPKILSRIFAQATAFDPNDIPDRSVYPVALAISHACSGWRALSVKTPELWTSIVVRPLAYPSWSLISPSGTKITLYDTNNGTTSLLNRYPRLQQHEVDAWLTRARRGIHLLGLYLARSGTYPLDVCWVVGEPVGNSNAAIFESLHEEYLRCILLTAGRWRTLQLDLSACNKEVESTKLLLLIDYQYTPQLTSFCIKLEEPRRSVDDQDLTWRKLDIWNDIIQRTPKLASPNLVDVSLTMSQTNLALARSVLGSQIKYLTLDTSPFFPSDAGHDVLQVDVLRIIRALPRIVRLAIRLLEGFTCKSYIADQMVALAGRDGLVFKSGVPSDPDAMYIPPPERPITTHSCLQELVLSGGAHPRGLASSLDLPALTKLSLVHTMPHTGPFSEEECGAVEWLEKYGSQLTHVILGCASLTRTSFNRILHSLHGVRSLTLVGQNPRSPNLKPKVCGHEWKQPFDSYLPSAIIDTGVLELLGKREVESGEWVVCPKLKRVELRVEMDSQEGRDALERAFVDLVVARCRRTRLDGSPLSPLREVVLSTTWKCGLDITGELESKSNILNDVAIRVEYMAHFVDGFDLGVAFT